MEPLCHELGPGQPAQLYQLLAALPSLPRAHPLLLNCSCYAVSQYSAWLSKALPAASSAAAPPGAPPGPPGSLAAPQQQLLATLLQMAVGCIEVPESCGGVSPFLASLRPA